MPLNLQDKREIEELLIRYSYLRDLEATPCEEFLSLFTDDAVIVSPKQGRFEGRKDLETFAEFSKQAPQGLSVRHVISNILIEGDGDVATMRAFLVLYMTRLEVSKRETKRTVVGHYECDVVRVDGAWKLRSRIGIYDEVSGGPEDYSDKHYTQVWGVSA